MDVAVYAVLILAIVSPLVLLHEFGHYAAARLSGCHVDQLDIGTGPPVFTRKRSTGTEYAVRALPLGGFCSVDKSDYAESRPSIRLFFSLAGSGANFLLAGVLLLFVALFDEPQTTVVNVGEGPAWQAGLRSGDRILSVDGVATDRWQGVGIALPGPVMDGTAARSARLALALVRPISEALERASCTSARYSHSGRWRSAPSETMAAF